MWHILYTKHDCCPGSMNVLLIRELCLKLFGLQEGDLFILGQYVAMSIIQGAGGFPFLAESVYKYLTSGVALGITVENADIADSTLHFVVTKVCISASK